MTGLIKQLRISLLVTLGVMAFGVLSDLLEALWSGDFLAVLGDDAMTAVIFCTLVAIVHTVIYGAMHIGRPETREARGVRAGLGVLLVLDVLPLLVAGYVALALIPVMTVVVTWGWVRREATVPGEARNTALLFGILSVPVQAVGAAIMAAVG